MFDETAPIGEIIDQNIAKNKRVPEGTEIELTVSKGTQFVTLPPLTDSMGVPITPEHYKAFLVENGLEVVIEYVNSNNTPSGQIDHLSHELVVMVDREKVKSITIFVAK